MKNDKTSINPDTKPPEDGAGLEPNDGENQKDEDDPRHEEPRVGVLFPSSPTARKRLARRVPEKSRPRENPQRHDREKIPPRLISPVHRRRKPREVLVDQVKLRPRRVALRRQKVPRQRDRQKQRDPGRQMQRTEPFPLVEDEQPQKHHRAGAANQRA